LLRRTLLEIDVVDDARSQQRPAGKVIVARITRESHPPGLFERIA
jgi:hypothetical protein